MADLMSSRVLFQNASRQRFIPSLAVPLEVSRSRAEKPLLVATDPVATRPLHLRVVVREVARELRGMLHVHASG